MSDSEQRPEGISRRQALKRMAAAGAVAWAVPTVQTLNMSRAGAATPGSPPPGCVQFRVNGDGTCANVNPINSCFTTPDPNFPNDATCAPVASAATVSGTDWTICLKAGCTLSAVSMSASNTQWCAPGDSNSTGTWSGYSQSGNCYTFSRPIRTSNGQPINISHIDLRVCCS